MEAVAERAGRGKRSRAGVAMDRFLAWICGAATGWPGWRPAVVFIGAHALLWTAVLTLMKAGQDIHYDTAEAFAWGQQFLLGYGKHPPLSGWIAGLWFRIFPTTDAAAYGLAMATLAVGLAATWAIARRVVDSRRAFVATVALAMYPIFNFKGYKYNADLLQLATLPLIVLAYLHAFERRSVRAGIWLGLAGAAGLMTKYWAVTTIGAVGLAALIHPQRMAFLRSPAPWVALTVLALAMLPHVVWLAQVHFLPFTYAGDVYKLPAWSANPRPVLDYLGHHLGLLAPVIVVTVLMLGLQRPSLHGRLRWAAFPASSHVVQPGPALNVWLVQAIIALGPPLAAWALAIYLKSDWGIPLFFLMPLALIALPLLGVKRIAMAWMLCLWLLVSLGALAASPWLAVKFGHGGRVLHGTGPRSEMALTITEAWHKRFARPLSVVVGITDVSAPLAFYSPDHPVPFVPGEPWSELLTSLDAAKRIGFVGICDRDDWRFETCTAWMAQHASGAEQMVLSRQRYLMNGDVEHLQWHVYIVAPAN